MRKFAAFDIDGTLFRSGLYREVFYELTKMEAVPVEIAEETTKLHRLWRHRTHGSAFEEFDRMMVVSLDNVLTKLKISDYDEAVKRVLEKKADNVYVYTRDFLKKLQKQGYFTIAISGSQQEIVEPFAARYNFDVWLGQSWERGEEYFTGKRTNTHTKKDVLLKGFIDQHKLTTKDSYAVGDSNGDLGMLEMAENPIVFNPTNELYQKALKRGWKIVVERKNVIYELEPQDGSHILISTEI